MDYEKKYKSLIKRIEELQAGAQCDYNSQKDRYSEAVLDVCHALLMHKTE